VTRLSAALQRGGGTYAQAVIVEEHFKVVGQVGHEHKPAHDVVTASATHDKTRDNPLVQVDKVAHVGVCTVEQAVLRSAVAGRQHGGADFLQSRHERSLRQAFLFDIPMPLEHGLHVRFVAAFGVERNAFGVIHGQSSTCGRAVAFNKCGMQRGILMQRAARLHVTLQRSMRRAEQAATAWVGE
jgi:hypothetical protein